MKKLFAAWVLPLMLLACSRAPEPAAPQAHAAPNAIAWQMPAGSDISGIFAAAKASNKPVFLYWGAVWCPPCNQIKATVFNRQDFIELSKMFVPVYLDGDTPGAQKIGAQFKVRGYPTMILFKPDGTELTRIPGEVDASKYVEVLRLGLNAGNSVKQLLVSALEGSSNKLSADAWRLLAYYAWDQDQSQVVDAKELASSLDKLAQACPPDQAEAASRLNLKAIVAHSADKSDLPDATAARTKMQKILNDTTLANQNFDVLVNYAPDIVAALSKAGSPDQAALVLQWSALLERFANDTSLSKADRLTAVGAKLALAKLGQAEGAKTPLDKALVEQVRQAVSAADKDSTTVYERQAVIPNAAELLSEAGLLDESDALLQSELPKALSPYYHMQVLAANAKARGDTAGSLNWAEKAWDESKGPATRLQWGAGYVNRLLEMAPQDSARIEQAASRVLTELEPNEETFFERNRRGLEKMGQRLTTWNTKGQHTPIVKRLAAQLNAKCNKLTPQSEAQAACLGVFAAKPPSTKIKA
jgi:thiol-disulfide isomerase/thioredoxin